MSLLTNRANPGHLTEALIHFNKGRDATARSSSKVAVARALFDGLNKLQTEWVLGQPDEESGEVRAFKSMVVGGLRPEAKNALLRSSELQSVVHFTPRVMNHDVLRRRHYRPGIKIAPQVINEASEIHRTLAKAYSESDTAGAAVEQRILKRTAELLYVVRSNIAHGEKTPYGPDLAKRERDEAVCSAIVQLQEKLVDLLLEYPSRRLVVYGTLAPGQPNHPAIEDLAGNWKDCIVRGSVRSAHDLPAFSWNPSGPELKAWLFLSADLPHYWSRIDAFEGSDYKRHLITADYAGSWTVANVYVGK